MALLKKSTDDIWSFIKGKHMGELLDYVAKNDPSYLQWVYENATEGMPDETFYALEDAMKENDIEIP